MTMRLSVVTPSLNQARFLPECLASVRESAANAAPHEVEHIVIDGGSDDGTIEVLHGQPDTRWVSEPDDGQSQAINKGLAMATGEILAYLCADDLYEPLAVAHVLEAFATHEEVDVIYADYFFLEGASGRKRGKSAARFDPARIRDHNPLGQPAVWWRRRVTEKFGPFDESLRFCMDHEYWLRLGTRVNWLHLAEPLACSRLHADAKTSRHLSAAWWETARMLTRDGWRAKPWWDALAMSLWGRHYYRLKRMWFAR
jgi:glycosyltransferase involved in cell wall biosynthesis